MDELEAEAAPEEFSNEQVLLESIPQIEQLDRIPMEPALLRSNRITTVVFFSILIITLLVLTFIVKVEDFDQVVWYILGGLVTLGIFSFWFAGLSFKHKNYVIREKDVLFQKGVIWRSTTVVPFNRVQHCDVKVGPIDRMFDLAELQVFTAGGTGSDVTIVGITKDTANRIKDFIIGKTGAQEDGEE